MSLRLVFVTDAAIGAVFGVGLLVVPGVVMGLYGVHLDAGGIFTARLFGAFIFGLAVMLWAARDAVASPAGIAMTRGQGIADVIALLLSAAGCFQGLLNAMGWTLVALFACFAAARIWDGFLRQPAPAPA